MMTYAEIAAFVLLIAGGVFADRTATKHRRKADEAARAVRLHSIREGARR